MARTSPDRPSGLAEGLVRVRKAAGIGQVELGQQIGLSQSHISHAEHGRRLLSPEQAALYARACGCDDIDTEHLVALARVASREHVDARSILQRGAITHQRRVQALEAGATLVREFQPAMVTGVCQTAAYVRAIFRQRPDRSDDEIEQLVQQRVDRGRSLVEDESRRWEIVHTEGAFLWCLGGPAVMTEQIDHLVAMSQLPHVRFGVIPAARPVDFTAHHGFSIYDSSTVQVGTISSTALLSSADDVSDHLAKFQRLLGVAVFGDEARAELDRVADLYRIR